jgi:hypothetical protein
MSLNMSLSEDRSFLISRQSAAAATSRHPESVASSYRAKVLGRALLATRTDVNSLWMLMGMPWPFVDNCDDHAGSVYNWCLVLLLRNGYPHVS